MIILLFYNNTQNYDDGRSILKINVDAFGIQYVFFLLRLPEEYFPCHGQTVFESHCYVAFFMKWLILLIPIAVFELHLDVVFA
jgi:hypothetical protein